MRFNLCTQQKFSCFPIITTISTCSKWFWYHLLDYELCHSTFKPIGDEEDTLKFFMAFDITPHGPVFRMIVGSQILVLLTLYMLNILFSVPWNIVRPGYIYICHRVGETGKSLIETKTKDTIMVLRFISITVTYIPLLKLEVVGRKLTWVWRPSCLVGGALEFNDNWYQCAWCAHKSYHCE